MSPGGTKPPPVDNHYVNGKTRSQRYRGWVLAEIMPYSWSFSFLKKKQIYSSMESIQCQQCATRNRFPSSSGLSSGKPLPPLGLRKRCGVLGIFEYSWCWVWKAAGGRQAEWKPWGQRRWPSRCPPISAALTPPSRVPNLEVKARRWDTEEPSRATRLEISRSGDAERTGFLPACLPAFTAGGEYGRNKFRHFLRKWILNRCSPPRYAPQQVLCVSQRF